MRVFLLKGENVKEQRVCATCKWLEQLPFADEYVCTNEKSEYAECPTDYPEKDTCPEWTSREEE